MPAASGMRSSLRRKRRADDGSASVELPLVELSAGKILYEPHPAVIRAGAFGELCRQLDARLIDPHIAYLLSSTLREHPLVQAFRLLEVFPFSLKQLNRRLQALGVGEIELKKRGFPMEPEQLRKRLKLTAGGRSAVLLIMRHGDWPSHDSGRASGHKRTYDCLMLKRKRVPDWHGSEQTSR